MHAPFRLLGAALLAGACGFSDAALHVDGSAPDLPVTDTGADDAAPPPDVPAATDAGPDVVAPPDASDGGGPDAAVDESDAGGADAADVPADGPPSDGGPVCAPDQAVCGVTCVSVQTDSTNCGTCGHACAAGQTCAAGVCGSGCPTPGQTACTDPAGGVTCVNLQGDGANCGTCSHACAAGQSCAAGVCGAGCPAGQTACVGGVCADLMAESANCGTCGHACAPGQFCASGVCGCAPGATLCSAGCANLQTDALDCETCGNACTAGQRCVAAACVCPAGQTPCAGACVPTQTDLANCGACGTACAAGQNCLAGACACPAGQTLCAGRCVDTATDRGHCGACGAVCPAAQTCAAGRCACPTGQSLCGTTCVDLQSSNANCGTCGTTCPATMSCGAGRCSCACAAGLSCCGAACDNLQTDPTSCGACGHACAAGTACRAGGCVPLNDDRAAATALPLGAGEATAGGTTDGATFDGPGGCSAADVPNVWYRLVVPVRSVVYADTAGSAYDTRLYLVDAGGVLVGGSCNDDASCFTGGFTSSLQSRFAVVVAAGTYYVAVSGFVAGSHGAFTLHVQHIPTNYGSVFFDAPLAGTATTPVRTLGGASLNAPASCAGGPAYGPSGEDARWFVTCGPTTVAGVTPAPSTFSNCMADGATYVRAVGYPRFPTYYDPVMYVFSGQTGAQVQCNDDGGAAFNCLGTGGDTAYYGSRISGPMPRGINAVVQDERLHPSGLTYTLHYQIN